jgi:hypothetical protein
MAGNFAWQFFVLSEFVSDFKRRLRPKASPHNALPGPSHNALSAASSGLVGLGYIFEEEYRWLSEDERGTAGSTLSLLQEACEIIGIRNISTEIIRIKDLLQYEKKEVLLIHLEHLTERITEELSTRSFVHIPDDKLKYYKQEEPFGDTVGRKFPKLIEDISNAGTCFALGQNTACVFHLMRVMEYCVQRFGKKLKINIDTRNESWYQIMLSVNSEINKMPAGKSKSAAQNNRKKRFSLAASRLDHVRIVWRNDAMHPKETYDEDQALEVLTSVEAFLKSVVQLI